jgi:hypothetical protein
VTGAANVYSMMAVKISLFWHNLTRRTESQLAACRTYAEDGIEKESKWTGWSPNVIMFLRRSEV